VALTGTAAAITPAAADIDATTTSDAPASTGGTTGGAGQTFTLTTGSDVLGPSVATAANQTTAGDDSIFALTDQSLTAVDIIDGGAGTDTLTAQFATAATNIAPVLTSVENLVVRQSGDVATTVDMLNMTGTTSLTFDRISEPTGVTAQAATNIGSGVALGITNTTSDDADTFTFTYTDAALAGTADTVTLNVAGNSSTASGVVVIRGTTSTTTGAGAETLLINSNTAASTLASVLVADGGGTTSTLATLNVAGSANLTITGALDFAGTTGGTINASGMSGNLNLTATTGNEPITFTGGSGTNTLVTGNGNDNLTGGAAADTFTIGTGNDTVTGGGGNDVVIVTNAGITTADTINFGDGTRDELRFTDVTTLNDAGVTLTNANITAFTGIEVIGSSGAVTAIDGNYFDQSIYNLSGNLTAAVVATDIDGDTIILSGNGILTVNGDALTLSGSLPNQSVTLELDDADIQATDGGAGNTALTIASAISSVTINSVTSGTAAVTNTLDLAAITTATHAIDNVSAQNFIVTGDQALTISSGLTAGFTNAINFDASAATGVISVVGSAVADVIKGGSAADTLDGEAGNDILTGGAGADTFVFLATESGTPSDISFEEITDFQKGVDIIDWDATLTQDAAAAAAVATVAQVSAESIATFNAADDTLAEKLVAATKGMDADGDFVVFEHSGSSYVYISGDANATQDADDSLIKLVGVTGLTDTTIDVNGNLLIA
jgi:Ca2+-binding RTX toxin-like protein